jgi:hypothetical protein
MSLLSLGLVGDSVDSTKIPDECRCGCKRFYKQTDFNRKLGLGIVGIASVATFFLAIEGYPWLITWSPMPMALVIDFSLSKSRPIAALCYKCGLIYRNVDKATLEQIEDFNLETYDLIKYPERQEEASQGQ